MYFLIIDGLITVQLCIAVYIARWTVRNFYHMHIQMKVSKMNRPLQENVNQIHDNQEIQFQAFNNDYF